VRRERGEAGGLTVVGIAATAEAYLCRREPARVGMDKMGSSPPSMALSSSTCITFSAIRQYRSSPVTCERYFISSCTVAASAMDDAPPSACEGSPTFFPRCTLAYGMPDGDS
jgi:hypothetical protein